MRTISSVKALQSFQIEVVYSDGAVVRVDVQPYIAEGGVFAALEDEELFCKVAVGPRGRSIEWPGEVDLCADAIWLSSAKSAAQAS